MRSERIRARLQPKLTIFPDRRSASDLRLPQIDALVSSLLWLRGIKYQLRFSGAPCGFCATPEKFLYGNPRLGKAL